jgi:hypothetical protein
MKLFLTVEKGVFLTVEKGVFLTVEKGDELPSQQAILWSSRLYPGQGERHSRPV